MAFTDDQGHQYLGLYDGFVVNNEDPAKRGRVKVKIPGLVEPSTNWARPAGGSLSSGEPSRGGFDPPKKGAAVYVQFLRGDLDDPVYFGGWRGLAGGKTDAPTEVQSASVSDAANKLKVYESDGFEVIIDERASSKKLSVRDKTNAVHLDIYDDRAEVKWGGDTGTLIRVKDARIQLGKDAVQSLVLGDLWWEAEDAALKGVILALRGMSAGCAGPLAALKPGVEAQIAFWQNYKNSGANKAFLSKLSKTE